MEVTKEFAKEVKFTKKEFRNLEDMSHADWLRKMREYAKKKCWEQKKLCNEYAKGLSEQYKELYGDTILNAPKPKFD